MLAKRLPATSKPLCGVLIPRRGMGDTAFDNEQNLAKLVPLVPHLTVKRYANVSHWVAQEVPDRVANDIKAFVASQ